MKPLVLVFTLLGLVSHHCLAERTIVEHAWPGAFKGQMTLAVNDCNSAINGEGWSVTVVFDQPVFNMDIWAANVLSRSADSRTYELVNKQWNAAIYPNTYLTLGFIGYRSQGDSDGTRGTATLNDNGLCSQGSDFSSSQSQSQVDIDESSCDVEMEVLDEWSNNVKGRVRLPITSRLQGGWTATLAFSSPIQNLQIWTASILGIDNNNQVYQLRNQQWNPTLNVGTVYEAEFIATYNSGAAPTFNFLLEDHPACDDITSEVSSVVDNGVCSCGTVRQLLDEWPSNFKGRARVPVTNSLNGGWTAELEFSEPVWSLQIWVAQVQSVDSTFTRYTVRNQQWNSNLAAGTELDVEFIGSISAATPDFQIRLQGQPDCECPDYYVPTTTVVATTTVSTTAPTTAATTASTTASTAASTTIASTTSALPTNAATTTKPSTAAPKETTTESVPDEVTTQEETTDEEVTELAVTTIIDESTVETTNAMDVTTEGLPDVTTKGLPDVTTDSPKVSPIFDYDEVLRKSILFYETQRSGFLPADNRIPFRGDSATNDRGNNGEDLTGGWYDAGDTVKFGLPMAQSATLLAWGLLEYEQAYVQSGEYANALDSIRWATDYFLKCHVSANEFYGQVGDGHFDHSLWGRPEELTGPRPAFKLDPSNPGSDLAGETAAALAAASIVFKKNAAYSADLLSHAQQLFSFAKNYPGIYSNSISNAGSFYPSSHYHDEVGYAAAWLYRATNDPIYYTEAAALYAIHGLGAKPWAFDWDDKKAGLQMLMFQMSSGTAKASYRAAVETYLDGWLRGGDVTYTPGGLAWRAQWGSLRYSANTAFLASIACREGLRSEYCEFAQEQIHYMLGANGRSFVVGFGVNPPDRPHHGSSSCPDLPAPCGWNEYNAPGPNPQVLYGALVGGPDVNDNFVNDRTDFIQNEVACDYNAGFQSAVAGIKQLLMDGLVPADPRALL
ncbi:uncharacterized protein [Diadema antillarum]|uniref:uncharacterized protein n=1 Tax=Diadema antillarum TaxID=105358 RepID=UPI003A86E8E8